MQYVTFDESDNLKDVVSRLSSKMTTLTKYFRMNNVDKDASQLLYKKFPEKYRCIKGKHEWSGSTA
uniref:Uncharacterized protein n=1 Tax=Oryza brachyantha TaxID=4533 RepID=J3M470_ORYBR